MNGLVRMEALDPSAEEFGYRSTLYAPLVDPTHGAVSRCFAYLKLLHKGKLRDQGVYPIHPNSTGCAVHDRDRYPFPQFVRQLG